MADKDESCIQLLRFRSVAADVLVYTNEEWQYPQAGGKILPNGETRGCVGLYPGRCHSA